ncbi:sialidase family protein [Pseudomonas delhiensis]|uniref:sialidase family protein n=1 Tax=Pseudomonas delhiensis TaxID=366289 RepID=UPI003159A6BB
MNGKLKTLCAAGLACMALLATGTARAEASGEPQGRAALAVARPAGAVLLGVAAADGGRLVAVGERGLVILSEDSGQHWRQARVPVSVTLTAVRFAGKLGVVVGHGGVVLVSSDAGESWSPVLDGKRAAQLALADARSVDNPALLQNAQLMVDEQPNKPLLDVSLGTDGQILAVGAYGLALHSADFGKTWQSWMSRLDNPDSLHLYAARQRGPVLLLAGERGLVLRSEDAGAHFQRLQLPYAGSLFTAELLSADELLVAGLRGSLLHSRDGGRSWQRVDNAGNASFTASSLGADGALYLANQAGQLLRWRDGGLAPLAQPALPPLNGVLPLGHESIVVLDNLGVSTLRLAGQ